MPRNDEGEFELILGNKQLLSVFFLVVILLGVFFTLGYVVGRSAGPLATVEMASNKTPDPDTPKDPLVVSPSQEGAPATAVPEKTPEIAAEKPAPVPSAPAPPPAATNETNPVAVPKPVAAAAPAAVPAEPATGQMFVQVAATGRPEAELLRQALGKRGFTVRLAPVPGKDLFRVLVGPLPDAAATAKARADLMAIGFRESYVRRY